MLTAFRLLPLGAKFAWAGSILLTLFAIVFSVGFIAYNRGTNISRMEIAKYQTEIAVKQSELDKATSRVDIKYVVKYIKDVQYIDRVKTETVEVIKTVVPEQFKLSQGWINTYNASIAGTNPQNAGVSTPSNFSDRYVLQVIASNNAQCLANDNKLENLQNLVKEREAEIAKINTNK